MPLAEATRMATVCPVQKSCIKYQLHTHFAITASYRSTKYGVVIETQGSHDLDFREKTSCHSCNRNDEQDDGHDADHGAQVLGRHLVYASGEKLLGSSCLPRGSSSRSLLDWKRVDRHLVSARQRSRWSRLAQSNLDYLINCIRFSESIKCSTSHVFADNMAVGVASGFEPTARQGCWTVAGESVY